MFGNRKITKETRHALYVADENGNIKIYRVDAKKPKPKPKPKSKPKRKPAMPKQLKVSKPTAQEMASKMPKCKVVLENLTRGEIAKIVANVERDGKLKAIKEQIKKFSCKKKCCSIFLKQTLIIYICSQY